MYGAEYFLIPAPKMMKPIFKKLILLKRGFQKCILLPAWPFFKSEPTVVQNAANGPNFEFSQFQPAPPPPPPALMVSENVK